MAKKKSASAVRRWFKRGLIAALIAFLLVNVVAFMHAYKFTHFASSDKEKQSSTEMTALGTAKALLLGVPVPRPENDDRPNVAFKEVVLENGNGELHSWWMPLDSARGTVALFHGYGACKSEMLHPANALRRMGFSTFLMDLSGSGDSEGNHCTIGHKEAKDVAAAYQYLQENVGGDIYLFGSSMGAATVLRAVAYEGVRPKGIIVECPFGSMTLAAKSRFENMGVPFWGFGHLLVFWGGVQNGFNAFKHSPIQYAKSVDVPTLLVWGERDDRVRRSETEAIFENLAATEKRKLYLKETGHVLPVTSEPQAWSRAVNDFLSHLENSY